VSFYPFFFCSCVYMYAGADPAGLDSDTGRLGANQRSQRPLPRLLLLPHLSRSDPKILEVTLRPQAQPSNTSQYTVSVQAHHDVVELRIVQMLVAYTKGQPW